MSGVFKGIYEFGGYRLDAETDTLWQEDNLISLSPKAFDVLKLLVVNQGNIVTKEEIFETVWKDTFVEDGVLTQNIYTLRNSLGKDSNGGHLIENIKRRGYRISVPVALLEEEASSQKDDFNEADRAARFVLKNEDSPDAARKSFASGQKKVLAAAAFAFFLLAAGFVFFKLQQTQKQAPPANTAIYREIDFQRLTDGGDVNFLTISPDGNWIAYSNSSGIFLNELQSGSEAALKIENFENFGSMQFSKDGTSLYFRSPDASFLPGNVYRTSRLGGGAKLAAEDVWSGFSFSPDDKKMAFTRVKPGENKQLLIVKDLETGAEREFSQRTPPLEFYPRNFPAWSSDGKKIVSVLITRTEHFAGLIVTDIETGREEEIDTAEFQNVEQVVWSADGRSLIASASDGKNFQLWKISYPDGKAERITNDLNDYLGISISADGRKLLARQRQYFSNIWIGDEKNPDGFQQITQGFARNEGLKGLAWAGNDKIVYTANYDKIRDWNLWVIDTAAYSRRQLTFDAGIQNEYPAVSADGNLIYYSSNSDESASIRRIGLTGENSSQITADENGSELFPQISPDGNRLYFIKKGNNSSAVWGKSLAGGREEKITSESEFSPANFLTLSPDGKLLAFQNLTKANDGEKLKNLFRFCVIPTENPAEKKFYDLPSFQPFAYFSMDGKALEFVKITPAGSEIRRQELGGGQSRLILSLKNDWIFQYARSPNGEKMAVSRGKLLRDAVLLQNFD